MHARSLLAVAVAALLVGPAAVHAQAKKATASSPAPSAPAQKTNLVGGWVGGEFGDLDGFQLRGDFVMPYQKLTPAIDLSFVGSVGYSYLSHSESASAFGVTASADTTGNVLKFVPAARFSMPVNPQITAFGDAGLGLYWASVKVKTETLGFTQSASSSDIGFMLRFAVGGLYRINPRMQVGVQAVVDPMLGGYEDTTFSILGGLTYAL